MISNCFLLTFCVELDIIGVETSLVVSARDRLHGAPRRDSCSVFQKRLLIHALGVHPTDLFRISRKFSNFFLFAAASIILEQVKPSLDKIKQLRYSECIGIVGVFSSILRNYFRKLSTRQCR